MPSRFAVILEKGIPDDPPKLDFSQPSGWFFYDTSSGYSANAFGLDVLGYRNGAAMTWTIPSTRYGNIEVTSHIFECRCSKRPNLYIIHPASLDVVYVSKAVDSP